MQEGSIILTKEEVVLQPNNVCRKNWPLKITAESTIPGLDSNIFVFHAADDADPVQGDTFSNVASLQDMESLPTDAPTYVEGDATEDFVPFYRVHELILDFYNLDELNRAWSIIKKDTDALVKEYRLYNKLKTTETHTAS